MGCGNCFQLGSRTNDIETITAQLEQKISAILPFPTLCIRKKKLDAAAHSNIHLSVFDEFPCDAFGVVWIGWMRVKRRARRIS